LSLVKELFHHELYASRKATVLAAEKARPGSILQSCDKSVIQINIISLSREEFVRKIIGPYGVATICVMSTEYEIK
jgi:hypothetical protein